MIKRGNGSHLWGQVCGEGAAHEHATRVYTTVSPSPVKSTNCMDRLFCCEQKSPYHQHHLYCSSAGARVWVCALPEADTVSCLSRSTSIPLLLLVILNTALLHRWMSAGDRSSAGVSASPEVQRVPHASRWAAYSISCSFPPKCGSGLPGTCYE